MFHCCNRAGKLSCSPHRFRFALLAGILFSLGSAGFGADTQPSIGNSERQARAKAPSAAPIVFTGSSSIAYWETLADDMKPLRVINSAFGGAQYTELLNGIDDLVVAYHPRAVVVYAGDNDLVSSSRKTPESVAGQVRLFVELVHAALPDTWVYVLSIKPSYSRWHAWPKMQKANELIEEYLRTQDRARFIDVATPMFTADGKLPRDLFVGDGLHPTYKCYQMWASIIRPVLLERFGALKSSLQSPIPPLRPKIEKNAARPAAWQDAVKGKALGSGVPRENLTASRN